MLIPSFHRDIAAEGTPSVATMMATQGSFTPEGFAPEATPIASPDTPTEAPAPSSADPAIETPPAPETVTQEAAPAQEAPPAPAPATETPAAPAPTWQDLIKSQPAEQVYQELGLDPQSVATAQMLREVPQMQAFLQHWQQNGNVEAYLRELATDYTQMPAEEVMRRQLRRDYPGVSEEEFAVLYEDEVVDRYKLNPDLYSEDEVRRGQMLLNARVSKYRTELQKEQEQFLLPKAPEPKAEAAPAQGPSVEEEVGALRTQFQSDPLFQGLAQSKTFTFGEGEEKFSFPVDPQAIADVLYDAEKGTQAIFRKEGERWVPDTGKQVLVGLVTAYGDAFLRGLAQHYKTLGARSAIDPLENPSLPSGAISAQSPVVPDNPAAAMAKGGRWVN